MATAGGTERFYRADRPNEVLDAMRALTEQVLPPPCTYGLASPPPGDDKLLVLFDGEPVPRDPTRREGWYYDGDYTIVSFYGSHCDALRADEVDEIEFVFACPGEPVE